MEWRVSKFKGSRGGEDGVVKRKGGINGGRWGVLGIGGVIIITNSIGIGVIVSWSWAAGLEVEEGRIGGKSAGESRSKGGESEVMGMVGGLSTGLIVCSGGVRVRV